VSTPTTASMSSASIGTGLILPRGSGSTSAPAWVEVTEWHICDFATNHLSQFLLTRLLSDLLRASAPSRVITVTSSAQTHVKTVDLDALVTGENFHHMHTYTATKLLNVLFITELSRRFATSGMSANAADPGFVRTRLGRDAPGLFGAFLKVIRPFQLSATKAAGTPVYLATSPDVDGVSGAYFAKCRQQSPGPLAQDQPTAERLWTLSEELAVSHLRG
jgi:NAD(P)-dependent dehydrogenase (short-subunit alcohol dehydrogenase family)